MARSTEVVCRHCGKEDTVSELVEETGWRGLRDLRPHPEGLTEDNGDPVFEYEKERVEHDGSPESTGWHCSNCDREERRLVELVEIRIIPRWECRVCGWAGSSTDDHPESCIEEPFPLDVPDDPIPGQVSLKV